MLQQINQNTTQELSEFARDSIGFFKGKGLPGRWTYSSPDPKVANDVVNGAALFTSFTQTPEYYLRRNEEKRLPELKEEILDLADYYNLLADMGCGNAFESKVAGLLANTDADYGPIDINNDFLSGVTRQCTQRFPEKKILPKLADFMSEGIHFPGYIPFPIMLGCTITNFGTTESVRQILKQAKKIAEQGNGSFLFTHDTNQREQSLRNTYLHTLMKQHTLNVLHRMKRDLPTKGFNPENFECDGYWDKNANTFVIYMRPTEDMIFIIAGEEISLKKGEILPQAPLMKLSSDHVLHLAELEGFEAHQTRYDQDGHIAFQHVHL
ncbi:MAG: L-histidine N(alpha)-methyltransferase [Pseudomonadota bacterium]